jgi:hypothetical protein
MTSSQVNISLANPCLFFIMIITVLGLSTPVLDERADHILREIEKNAPNGERYSLVGKVVSGCVALLVYARDDGIARRIVDVQTQWTTCGPAWMSNKGLFRSSFFYSYG